MRPALAFAAALAAVAVLAAAALAAGTLSVSAPASVQESDPIPAAVSGTTDEPGLTFVAYVQPAVCPATLAAAQQQAGAVSQGRRAVHDGSATGPYSFNASLAASDAQGNALIGQLNICSYLYRTEADFSRTTVAADADRVEVTERPPAEFKLTVPARPRMSDGRIAIFVVCPDVCDVRVVYKGLARGRRTKNQNFGGSDAQRTVKLPLDRKTRRAVRRQRREGVTRGVKVEVDAVARQETGDRREVERTVRVR